MTVRVGLGFDAHRLVAGRKLVLGGTSIEHARGLEGHSDGDVLLHAVADALFGAVAQPDIGSWFPSGDSTWQGAPSRLFVEKAVEVAAEKGFHAQQIDVVIIAEEPKLATYLPAMRAGLSRMLRIPESAVGLKATTTDGMGFTGRGEGIAVQAVVTVVEGES